jgi:hypothetical protein
MSFRLARIRLDSEQAERKGLRIYWEAFADNAPVEAGSSGVTMTVRLD